MAAVRSAIAEAVGVLGGTFDPVHFGHLSMARTALEALHLDRVLLIPNGQPPHRAAPEASPAQRLEMLRAATADDPRLQVDDREIRRGGPSYTVDTLTELAAELGPETRLVLLLGADAFAEIHEWSRWRRLFDLAEVVVFAREGARSVPDGVPQGRIRFVREAVHPASASEIRARIAAGKPCEDLLPDEVMEIVERDGLYRGGSAHPGADCQSGTIGE